eukprot:CAMPEP_0196721430 /NCGR_PEP_ID=MMETSP1091-20130531/3982_1 /TAXON_ID=302021 /ORGANISM="Rhodomonas sp., Strain CCMP768" /LENGTH=97 /DNA_ID=CAMNT_0042062889 /DNA_START=94 /DNA_END=388 /DNA_ORIENTATION=-
MTKRMLCTGTCRLDSGRGSARSSSLRAGSVRFGSRTLSQKAETSTIQDTFPKLSASSNPVIAHHAADEESTDAPESLASQRANGTPNGAEHATSTNF